MFAVATTFSEAAEPAERVAQRQRRREQVCHPPVLDAVPPRIPDRDHDRADEAAVENEPAAQRVEAFAAEVVVKIVPISDEVEQLAAQHAEDEQVERQVENQFGGNVLLARTPGGHPDAREETAGHKDAIPVDNETAVLKRDRMHNRYLAERGALRKGDSGFNNDAIRGVDAQPGDSARAVEQTKAAGEKRSPWRMWRKRLASVRDQAERQMPVAILNRKSIACHQTSSVLQMPTQTPSSLRRISPATLPV
ncbi:MAG: hypothetical protein WC429_06050 [Verrucomicrobiia bacterium]